MDGNHFSLQPQQHSVSIAKFFKSSRWIGAPVSAKREETNAASGWDRELRIHWENDRYWLQLENTVTTTNKWDDNSCPNILHLSCANSLCNVNNVKWCDRSLLNLVYSPPSQPVPLRLTETGHSLFSFREHQGESDWPVRRNQIKNWLT